MKKTNKNLKCKIIMHFRQELKILIIIMAQEINIWHKIFLKNQFKNY